ncbi:MAG: WecB/TagA/CpsF family glycosyltransferase [Pseudomonadota bacterium]
MTDGIEQEAKSYRIFGFPITPVTKEDILDLISGAVSKDSHCIIASQNMHGVYTYFKDEQFRKLHDQSVVHIDGMPIIWMARLCGLKLGAEYRTGWIDWFMPLMERATRENWRVFYLGSEDKVLQDGLAFVRKAYPNIQLAGRNGFFNSSHDHPENLEVINEINDFGTNVLIVGMGMGRQEHWILENLDRLKVNCIGTSGACIEYFAGAVPTPPRWLGSLGLEWAYRLLSNPRRFAWRYLVEPWITAWLILANQFRERSRKHS